MIGLHNIIEVMLFLKEATLNDTEGAMSFSTLVLTQAAIKIPHNDLIGSYLQEVAKVVTSINQHTPAHYC